MPANLNSLVERVSARLANEAVRDLTDDALIARFVKHQDQVAFTTLVERHAGLVLSVCRRILGSGPDAEDAFQATFLVLARRAQTIRWEASIRGWLYRVALQVARRVRQRLARQRQIEQTTARAEGQPPGSEVTWTEGLASIDREIDALPANYRTVLLACCLEGKSREEASNELGLSPGQVKGLLERARDLLRARLARRGIVLPATLVALLLQQGSAQAASTALVTTTTQTSLALVAGQSSTIAPTVLSLADATLSAMTFTKTCWAVGIALVLALFAVGGVWMAQPGAEPMATALTVLEQELAVEQPPAFQPVEQTSEEPVELPAKVGDGRENKKVVLLRGRVKSVDVETNSLMLAITPRGQPTELRTLRILPDARFVVRGEAGTLADLQPGDSLSGRFLTEPNALADVTIHPPENKK